MWTGPLKRTAKKCTKIYNARVQLLFSSLNLLFSDVPVAVAVKLIIIAARAAQPAARKHF